MMSFQRSYISCSPVLWAYLVAVILLETSEGFQTNLMLAFVQPFSLTFTKFT